MSKAVLVIDMPENCTECVLCHEYRSCAVTGEGFFRAVINPHEERLKSCPLKALPEKEKLRIINSNYVRGYKCGYNDCIDKIGGDNG